MAATTTIVLGGGFAGMSAANSLRRLVPPEHEVVVIDKSPRFHVGAGKSWMMLGERTYEQISERRTALLAPGIRFIEAKVLGLDLPNRSVTMENVPLNWDHLVIALGADLDMTKVPGLAEAAHTFYTVEGAKRLGAALEQFPGGDVAILIPKMPIMCPPAPYEAAMLLHHAFENRGLGNNIRIAIHTVEGAPMTTAGPEMGRYLKGELARRRIAFHPQKTTVGVDGAARRVLFEDGSEMRYDLLIGIPPHEAPILVREARLTNPSGWIPVDPQTLRVTTRPEVGELYAVGDVASIPLPGRYRSDVALSLPKAGAFAEAQGRVVAHRIAAKILARASSESFDGRGYCYLETGGHRAVRVAGSFFELPHPVMETRPPDEAQFRDKLDWVARHLQPIR